MPSATQRARRIRSEKWSLESVTRGPRHTGVSIVVNEVSLARREEEDQTAWLGANQRSENRVICCYYCQIVLNMLNVDLIRKDPLSRKN